MNDRHDQLSHSQSTGTDPGVHAGQAGIGHCSLQISQRCTVVHSIDDDVFVEIVGAGRILDEKAGGGAAMLNGEQEGPTAPPLG